MNDQLQEALLEILTSALSAKDFLVSNLPDVINQLLVWKFWASLSLIPMAVVLIAILFILIKLTRKYWDVIHDKDGEILVVPLIAVYGLVVIPFSFFMLFDFTWLQIWLAPKVYLIEYAASLAK